MSTIDDFTSTNEEPVTNPIINETQVDTMSQLKPVSLEQSEPQSEPQSEQQSEPQS
jgi:hypothetical protein